MRFITCGTSDKPSLIMIHGMATTAEICYHDLALKLSEHYYVILAVLDGHDPESSEDFISPEVCCVKIEKYIREQLEAVDLGVDSATVRLSFSGNEE